MNCPVCKHALKEIKYEGIRIHTCAGCGGEWVGGPELAHIVRAREVRFSADECKALLALEPVTAAPLEEYERTLGCPQCGGTMVVYRYAADTGIILDRCPSCRGVWLDADELENVQRMCEGWGHRLADLPDDLARHGPRLKAIARQVEAESVPEVSRFAFVNALIHRVLDVLEDRGIA